MQHKPLTNTQKAIYKQLVRDKTFTQRVGYFIQSVMKILMWIGVLALIGYGCTYVYILVVAKSKADTIERKIDRYIKDAQKDSYPD